MFFVFFYPEYKYREIILAATIITNSDINHIYINTGINGEVENNGTMIWKIK